jgi:hypothetical protein
VDHLEEGFHNILAPTALAIRWLAGDNLSLSYGQARCILVEGDFSRKEIHKGHDPL